MYSGNNNIGRRSYNNYPSAPSWAPPGWSNQPSQSSHPIRQTRPETSPSSSRSVLEVRLQETEETIRSQATQITEQNQLLEKMNKAQDESQAQIATLAESLQKVEKTLIDNENLVQMQNYLYQANMTIANMVQEMITKYFNETPHVVDPLDETQRNVTENSTTILSGVKRTLEQVTQQNKETLVTAEDNPANNSPPQIELNSDNTTGITDATDNKGIDTTNITNTKEVDQVCNLENNQVDADADADSDDEVEGTVVDIQTSERSE